MRVFGEKGTRPEAVRFLPRPEVAHLVSEFQELVTTSHAIFQSQQQPPLVVLDDIYTFWFGGWDDTSTQWFALRRPLACNIEDTFCEPPCIRSQGRVARKVVRRMAQKVVWVV